MANLLAFAMLSAPAVTFSSSEIEVVVLPDLGARLHRLTVHGQQLLRSPDDLARYADDTFYWGAFQMAPWCNRITARRSTVSGRQVDLPTNFEDGSAIHGQVYARPWQQVSDMEFRIEYGGDGWPWQYAALMRVHVIGDTLTLEQSVTNLSDAAMPAGIGIHPWFAGRPDVAIHADSVYPSNTASEAQPLPVSGDLDLRRRAAMAVGVDATWPQVGDPAVELWWPDLRLHAKMRALTGTPHIVAANPGTFDAIAVETETHAPRGLGRLTTGDPGALTLLDPGATLSLTTVLEFDQLT